MPDPLFPDAAFHARIRELEAGRDRLAADKVRLLLRAAKLETALIEAVALIGETSLDLLPEAAEVIQRWRELLGPATQTYPGRTDETERAFEGDTVTDRRDPRSPAFRLGTIPNPNGPGIVELDPTCCHHGHPLNPGTSTRGWQPCGGPHPGHRTWECWHPVDGQRCGDLVQWPPTSDACTPISGYGTGGSP